MKKSFSWKRFDIEKIFEELAKGRYLTIDEISQILHRSKDSTRRLVKEEMKFIRDGKRMLIPESSLAKYLDSHTHNRRGF